MRGISEYVSRGTRGEIILKKRENVLDKNLQRN
jgi:hypothetical protein